MEKRLNFSDLSIGLTISFLVLGFILAGCSGPKEKVLETMSNTPAPEWVKSPKIFSMKVETKDAKAFIKDGYYPTLELAYRPFIAKNGPCVQAANADSASHLIGSPVERWWWERVVRPGSPDPVYHAYCMILVSKNPAQFHNVDLNKP
jgi:hypothetical protein